MIFDDVYLIVHDVTRIDLKVTINIILMDDFMMGFVNRVMKVFKEYQHTNEIGFILIESYVLWTLNLKVAIGGIIVTILGCPRRNLNEVLNT